jgi:hypothetical protein
MTPARYGAGLLPPEIYVHALRCTLAQQATARAPPAQPSPAQPA